MKEISQLCVLVLLTALSLTGCASVNPLGNNISGEVVMPDGTRARNVDIIVYYKRTGFVGGSEGIGPRESDRKIHSRTGAFKTHFVGLLGITGVQAFSPGWESDFYDFHSAPPPRDLMIKLHPRGEGPPGIIAPPPALGGKSSRPPVPHYPLSPTAADRNSPPPTSQRTDRPPPNYHREPNQALGVADVKVLAKEGVSDEVIISQIRNSRTVFHLTTTEIIELKESGVSNKVIDFMINTPETAQPGTSRYRR